MATDLTTNIIQYGSRTFGDIRADEIAYIKQAYPDIFSDFTDSSVGALLIDLNAGVTNNLSINTDRVFQETQLDYAQQKASLLNLARNMGFNIPARRPSVTVIDFTVNIPVLGDRPDASYYPQLAVGAQVIGGGKTFETQDIIDWNSPVSNLGDPNRSILPNLDPNGIVQNYSVTKREVVINGSSNIYKRIITSDDVVPFFTVTLPDPDVIEIDGAILLEGTNFSSNPPDEDFSPSMDGIYDKGVDSIISHYYQVDYLAQQRVFTDVSQTTTQMINNSGLTAGKWIDVTKKFVMEFDVNGYCTLTFGSGDADVNAFKEGFLKAGVSNQAFLDNFLNNTALGEKLKANYTLFIKYRTGGGSNSNVGAGTLTQLGNYNLQSNGSNQTYVQTVQRSLQVNNPIPAIGGNDGLSVEQIRQLIKYNFASQERDVSITDYLLQLYKMPGKYGSPFRANAQKLNNKIVISILGLDNNGKLLNTSTSLMQQNIAEYLSQYRMVNDYIEVADGQIFNLAFDIDVYVENTSNNTIANSIVTLVTNYLDINNHEMNEDLFLGPLQTEILNANGVINILDIKVYNKVGGQYSNNVISQAFADTSTGEIEIINNTIYSTEDSMFEIRYPSRDIRVFLRKQVG